MFTTKDWLETMGYGGIMYVVVGILLLKIPFGERFIYAGVFLMILYFVITTHKWIWANKW